MVSRWGIPEQSGTALMSMVDGIVRAFHPENSNSLKKPRGTETICLGTVFRRLKLHMALGSKIVNLVGLCVLDSRESRLSAC